MTARRARKKRSLVLLVDDHLEETSGIASELKERHTVRELEPKEVEQQDIDSASVVLVDLKLEDESVGQPDAGPLIPRNGISLISTFRYNSSNPAIYALHSGKLHELGATPYSIARAHNMEWAFSKQHSSQTREGVATLSEAFDRLQKIRVHDEPAHRTVMLGLLDIPKQRDWTKLAHDAVDAANPPSHHVTWDDEGRAFVRWLLHQVLPFPTFLLDETYLAARLRVTPRSMKKMLRDKTSAGQKLRRALAPARYDGILANFLGTRWWRAGVESLIWKITKGDPFDPAVLKDAVARALSPKLEPVDLREPVVALDRDWQPLPELVELTEAVQVLPDDWPAHADTPWARIEDAHDDPGIGGVVISQDQPRLASYSSK